MTCQVYPPYYGPESVDGTFLMMSHGGKVGSPARPKPKRGMQPACHLFFLLVLNLSLCRHITAADSADGTAAAPDKHWAFVPPLAVVPPSLRDSDRPIEPGRRIYPGQTARAQDQASGSCLQSGVASPRDL